MKRSAPSAQRNREPIAEVLREELPGTGLVLEFASGTGEHAYHFARISASLEWQPSDADPDALTSITAWREEAIARGEGANLRPPVLLDVCEAEWKGEPVAALLAINLVHISPAETAKALMDEASRVLAAGDPLILYGPFIEEGVETAPSNLAFDESLRARDERWGLRHLSWLDALAEERGLYRSRRASMPANNLLLVYRRR